MTEHAIRDAAESSSAQRIRLIEDTATVRGRLLKRRRKCPAWQAASRFLNGEASLQRARNGGRRNITNAGTWRELAGFVLNAPLSSVISG
jgi:hypothetical protein